MALLAWNSVFPPETEPVRAGLVRKIHHKPGFDVYCSCFTKSLKFILTRSLNVTALCAAMRGVNDLFKPGLKVRVVNGAGKKGVWEDMAGRKGDIKSVAALRSNLVGYAKNSAEAKQTWTDNKGIDVWLIWNIWQVANPQLADVVPIEPEYAIYRDTGIAITSRAENKPVAKAFLRFLQSAAGAKIFANWGWKTGHP